ncbi:dihydrofolate reductase family protein [Chitinophaga sp. sic0106]|uniref:dihydrofolate reductase family protein n=1 Tax=Chitinophaga sp. sic0106 TaxID=2854785 RepID=UPI001C472E02|nr:dihydrofolate reductase family protein [Chitinophaga sp. sic0106]MBV7532458.1 dihydrofolate reductase family protein [Chitinophaga sp. sic0106]
MRKLMMKMSLSIDGFVSGPNGEADWIFRSSDETSRAWALEQYKDAGLIIMGRKSFESMSKYWPGATGPFTGPMNELPKGVFTMNGFTMPSELIKAAESNPAAATWAQASIHSGDLTEEINKLKSQPGKPIMAAGGAGFMSHLIAKGLIDEYHLITHPVVLGKGLPIFQEVAQPTDLKLAEVKSFPGGIVAHIYRP